MRFSWLLPKDYSSEVSKQKKSIKNSSFHLDVENWGSNVQPLDCKLLLVPDDFLLHLHLEESSSEFVDSLENSLLETIALS